MDCYLGRKSQLNECWHQFKKKSEETLKNYIQVVIRDQKRLKNPIVILELEVPELMNNRVPTKLYYFNWEVQISSNYFSPIPIKEQLKALLKKKKKDK